MLLPPERVLPRLVCPRCRAALVFSQDGARCGSPSCPGAARPFPTVGSQPALIDFEHSVVAEEELLRSGGRSAVPRHALRGPRRWFRGLYMPANPVAERHARMMVERLRRPGEVPTLLVVGGGTVGTGAELLYESPEIGVIGFDIYASPRTHFVADGQALPLPDRSVDAVWVQAVLEHVLEPARVVAEIERVLCDGGLVYAETPFLQQVHEGPYDFTRFTESGHRWLFRRFERLGSGVVTGCGNQLVWSLDSMTRSVLRSKLAGRLMRMATFWLQWADHWIPERFAVDGASCVYFYGSKSGRELTPREIVAHYRGAQTTR